MTDFSRLFHSLVLPISVNLNHREKFSKQNLFIGKLTIDLWLSDFQKNIKITLKNEKRRKKWEQK